MSRGYLPFRANFQEAIAIGLKTCTARTKRYGNPGDVLDTIAGPIVLTSVRRVSLSAVRDQYWKDEGCASPSHFEKTWASIHPRKGFVPEQVVWLHTFRREGRG